MNGWAGDSIPLRDEAVRHLYWPQRVSLGANFEGRIDVHRDIEFVIQTHLDIVPMRLSLNLSSYI